MNEEERVCRRCLLIESGKDGIMLDIRKRIENLSEEEKSSAGVYDSRLAVCKNCDYLVGGTCMKCGCYPEFRAAFRKQRCPANKWS